MNRSKLFVALWFCLTGVLWAQEGDPLFTNPEPDSPADTTQKVPLDAYTGQSMKFFETLNVDGYWISGYKESGELVNSPYNALTFGFGSDVRLDSTARAYASFNISYPAPATSASSCLTVGSSP